MKNWSENRVTLHFLFLLFEDDVRLPIRWPDEGKTQVLLFHLKEKNQAVAINYLAINS